MFAWETWGRGCAPVSGCAQIFGVVFGGKPQRFMGTVALIMPVI